MFKLYPKYRIERIYRTLDDIIVQEKKNTPNEMQYQWRGMFCVVPRVQTLKVSTSLESQESIFIGLQLLERFMFTDGANRTGARLVWVPPGLACQY